MKTKYIFFLGFLFGVLALAADSIRLPVTTVVEATDRRVRTFPGRVVPVAQVNVVPQVTGEILEVGFENGAVVKAGDLLYRLDSVKYEAAVKNAQAKVAECKATLAYAELSFARHKTLLGTRAVSQDAVDNALSTRDSARAALAAAQADLASARDDLRHCRIVAPIAGKLGSTQYTAGNYIQKGECTLVTLIQMAPIRVRFSISNRDFLDLFNARNKLAHDESILSLRLANGEAFAEKGEVEYVDNAADETTDTIQLFALFPNAERKLKPGGTVAITLSSQKGVRRPAIPPTAILQDTQGPYVWALDAQNRAERRTIARGEAVGDLAFVEKGLKVGERIVADGAHRVKRGMIVEAVK